MIEKLLKAFQNLGFKVERSDGSYIATLDWNSEVHYGDDDENWSIVFYSMRWCSPVADRDDEYLCISILQEPDDDDVYNMIKLHAVMERLNSTLTCIKAFFIGDDLCLEYERRIMPHENLEILISNAVSRLEKAHEVACKINIEMSGETIEDKRPLTPGTMQDGHEWVDLGLSKKWATCNIGANSPEEYGDYYSWGMTETIDSKQYYDEGPACDIKGDKTDDTACVLWGGDWQMPSKREMQELEGRCIWSWVKRKGVHGYRVVSKINGNSIFFPAAGYSDKERIKGLQRGGYYWSSTPRECYDEGGSCSPYHLFFDDSTHDVDSDVMTPGRTGHSIRPVI